MPHHIALELRQCCNWQLREAAAGYARACVNGVREARGLGDVNISFLVGSVFDEALLQGTSMRSCCQSYNKAQPGACKDNHCHCCLVTPQRHCLLCPTSLVLVCSIICQAGNGCAVCVQGTASTASWWALHAPRHACVPCCGSSSLGAGWPSPARGSCCCCVDLQTEGLSPSPLCYA